MKVIILANGIGTQLWPLSRSRYPKQFIKFQGKAHSLFQETFNRSLLLAKIDDIYIATNRNYKFLVMGEIEELDYEYREDHILVEPEAKNTLPAIYAGISEIIKKGHDSVVVFPSDQIIQQAQAFIQLIQFSEYLTKDSIITFGIKPDSPQTGYGYISPGDTKGNGYRVKEFKEKPDYQSALEYIKNGYYWNSGIFLFDTRVFLEEAITYTPEIMKAFQESQTLEEAFSKITVSVSMDYGILEKSRRTMVVPADIGWNDLECFDSFYDVFDKDGADNITGESHILLDSNHNIIHSEAGKLVCTIGIDHTMIVDTKDALLVCKQGKSQKVKEIVDRLKRKNDLRTVYHVQDYRPWGNY